MVNILQSKLVTIMYVSFEEVKTIFFSNLLYKKFKKMRHFKCYNINVMKIYFYLDNN